MPKDRRYITRFPEFFDTVPKSIMVRDLRYRPDDIMARDLGIYNNRFTVSSESVKRGN